MKRIKKNIVSLSPSGSINFGVSGIKQYSLNKYEYVWAGIHDYDNEIVFQFLFSKEDGASKIFQSCKGRGASLSCKTYSIAKQLGIKEAHRYVLDDIRPVFFEPGIVGVSFFIDIDKRITNPDDLYVLS